MEQYRFFFLDDQSHIHTVQTVEALNDEAAIAEAYKLLNGQNTYQIAELWQLKRRVAQLRA